MSAVENFGLPNLPGIPNLRDLSDIYAEEGVDAASADTGVLAELIPPGKRAVIYLRVSDPSQAKTSRQYAHGASMETQRAMCLARARELGLTVVQEYIEPGRSAMSIERRPTFRQMLARIQEQRDVDVVLVYMFERAARNQWEDAIVGTVFQALGVELVSVTEPIADTPAGKAMRGMISVFNELSSTSRGADIKRKMEAAAKRGKTLGRARLGYRNARDITDGQDIRYVEIDQERAPFVKLAFELYATGEYTVTDIADELAARGLTTRPTAKHPAGPVSVSKIHTMLGDRYYIGFVSYEGEEFMGQHEPLVDPELFETVQGIRRSRGHAAERRREHNHYLKGTVFCGECWRKYGIERRLIIQRAVGRHGGEYFYFFCPGGRLGECSQPHHNLFRVEEAIEKLYKSTRYDAEFVRTMRTRIVDAVSDQSSAQRILRTQLRDQLKALDVHEENLLDLAADPDVPNTRIKNRLLAISTERDRIREQLSSVDINLSAGVRFLEASLDLLEQPWDLYRDATDEVRRRLNQAIFDRVFITDEDVTAVGMREPHGHLFATQAAYHASTAGLDREAIDAAYTTAFANNTSTKQKTAPKGGLLNSTATTTAWHRLFTPASTAGGSNTTPMVEMGGIEPPSIAVVMCLLRV